MAHAYVSSILKVPVETVWSLVRDFNGLPQWAPGLGLASFASRRTPGMIPWIQPRTSQ